MELAVYAVHESLEPPPVVIDEQVTSATLEAMLGHPRVRGPEPSLFQESIRERVGDLHRPPAAYLRTGVEGARDTQSQTVRLRHVLPACEHWPYPFNRYW